MAVPRRRLLHRRFDSIFFIFIGVIYLWIVSDRNWDVFAPQDFGDVYDHLALRMAQGRFDLPPAVLGGEAFVVEGKYYGYWPPFPAVIRLPLVWLAGDGWPGHTARAFSWLAAMLTVCAARGALDEMHRLPGGRQRGQLLLPVLMVAFALGSHLPYLLAGPSTYHEAVLWGTATAVGSLHLGLRFLRHGRFASLTGAVLLAGASAASRATVGYGALIGATGLGVLWCWQQRPVGRWTWPPRRGLLLLGLAGLCFAFPLWYNFVRFGTWVRLPYQNHVSIAPWRQAIVQEGHFQAVNLLPNVRTYFDPTQIDVRPAFPYFHLAAYREKPGARIEHAEALAGIPAWMTGLGVLGVFGLTGVNRERRLALLWLGGGATLGAVLTFAAVAHRYEHDLFPSIVLLAGGGALWLNARAGRLAGIARFLLVLLLGFGLWQSLSIAYFELEWARRWSARPAVATPAPSQAPSQVH